MKQLFTFHHVPDSFIYRCPTTDLFVFHNGCVWEDAQLGLGLCTSPSICRHEMKTTIPESRSVFTYNSPWLIEQMDESISRTLIVPVTPTSTSSTCMNPNKLCRNFQTMWKPSACWYTTSFGFWLLFSFALALRPFGIVISGMNKTSLEFLWKITECYLSQAQTLHKCFTPRGERSNQSRIISWFHALPSFIRVR